MDPDVNLLMMLIDYPPQTGYNLATSACCLMCGELTVRYERMQEEELTADQVADELKVHPKRVYKWIRNGELAATDLGTRARHNYRISRSDLNDFKRRRRTTQRGDEDENI
jgi:excisionase family DNA binding protein